MNKTAILVLITAGITLALCCCLVFALAAGIFTYKQIQHVIPTISAFQTIIPNDITPTPFEITRQPVDENNSSTLRLLEKIIIPDNDPAVLACRFKHVCNVPPTVPAPANWFEPGGQTQLWLLNADSNEYSKISVTLQVVTPHAYLWVEDGVDFNKDEAQTLVDAFENSIYPTDREFFGSEWTPGVDDDPHLYIVYASHLGGNAAGFFNPGDEYPPQINQHSNAHESFYIDSSESLADVYTYCTLAHEFQHMIHWNLDKNESSFLDEGFSELACFLNGYSTGGFDWYYTLSPDLNITDWLGGSGDNGPHYGASFLFVTYFLDRFGKDATQALVHDQQNSMASVDDVLQQLKFIDPISGRPITADDFFLDWTITNAVNEENAADGRYFYHNYPNSPTMSDTEDIATCTQDQNSRTVNQYGVDYIRFTCRGDHTINFTGATLTHLLPVDPHSGSYAYWSNKGDKSDMTLTRQFDLNGVSGQISFNYWTWFDLENDYDYLYLETSTDGVSWSIVTTPSGTAENPSGEAYGWGYSGQSNGWIQETVDLSQYAGQEVWLRFDYITDAAVTYKGFLVDDISIPQIGYSENFESSEGGWVGEGFARVQNILPQTFHLGLISHTDAGTKVDIFPVNSDGTAQIPVSIGSNGVQDVVLVVTATTRFTLEEAAYQFEIR